MTTWLISDLHLSAQRPAVTQAFLHWLAHEARGAEALYLLGDIFDVWLGDDVLTCNRAHATNPALMQLAETVQQVVAGLHALSAQGTTLYAMHGNRDFLLGEGFAKASGLQLLPDPTEVVLAQQRVLLTHGDTLCTEDVAYQAFRQTVRATSWQQTFLSQPLPARHAFATQAREQSQATKAAQSMAIMDVHPAAVDAMLRAHAYPAVLLHGHTHRPAIHQNSVDGHAYQRIVLGDWHDSAVVCRVSAHTIGLVTLTL